MASEKRKIGEGSLRAWLRQGHKEIGQAIPSFRDSIQVVEEPGTFSNPTSYEVSKQTGAVETRADRDNAKVDATEPTAQQDRGNLYGYQSQTQAEIHHEPDDEPDLEP